ncbi:MAG: hypothetical protein K2I23_00995 [Clostridia bacterium]|nr:hypothetical protein [Clostridia bacterium]
MNNKWLRDLFPNLFKKQENEEPKKTSDDFISQYLQSKQAGGEKLNAKDYFAQDALDGVAVGKLQEALRKTLGCEKVEPCNNALCKDWNDVIKCVSVSVKILDCLEETVIVNLVVDGEEDVIDWVDVWIGEVNEPDSTINLDEYPKGAVDSSFIYDNAAQKVMDCILTKMV